MLENAIKYFGNQQRLAEALEVTPQLVHQWVTGKRPIAPTRCRQIEQATSGAVRAADLRPEIFGPIEKPDAAA